MDTWTPASGEVDPSIAQVALIKAHMPGVYGAIAARAERIGNAAFNLVRRGARGETDCFYAFEGGRVVGTPFCQAVTAEIAASMVEFGVSYVCVWPATAGKEGDGAN